MNKIIKSAKEIVEIVSTKKQVNPYDKNFRAAAAILKSLELVAQTKTQIKALKKELKEKKNIVAGPCFIFCYRLLLFKPVIVPWQHYKQFLCFYNFD